MLSSILNEKNTVCNPVPCLLLHRNGSLWKPTQDFLEEYGKESGKWHWMPTFYVHMPDAECTWGFSRLLCHCSDIFSHNFTPAKRVKKSRCNRIWLRKIHSTIQLHRLEEQPRQMTDSQSPDSPAWYPDMAVLCLLLPHQWKKTPSIFLGSSLEATAGLS